MKTPDQEASQREAGLWLPLLLLVVTLITWAALALRTRPRRPVLIEPPSADVSMESVDVDAPVEVDRALIFEEQIRPLLGASAERHANAIQRTLQHVDDQFDEYRSGVEPFVRDLTSLGTRGGVLWRKAKSVFGDGRETDAYVREKFERHMFSDAELAEFLTLAVRYVTDEFEADRNKLLRDVRTRLDDFELPSLELPDYAAFTESTSAEMQRYASEMATDSALVGVGTFVAAETAAIMVTSLIARALPVLIAGAGGATVASSGAGGAGGSLAGPVGTGIGIVGGFAVGAAVDWWLTEELEEQLAADMSGLVDDIRHALIDGDGESGGLRHALEEYAELLERAQSEVLESAVVGN